MKIKRILFTGISVLAISSLSNCFLTSWLGEALNPYGSISGAKVQEIIQKAASDGYSYAGLTYTSSKTKYEKTIDDLSVNTVGQDNEPIPGQAQQQLAFVQQIAKLASNVDPGATYTAASVKNCAAAVQSTSYAVALSQIESADKETANCVAATKDFADLKFAGVLAGSCYNFDGATYDGATATTNMGSSCLGCVFGVVNTTPSDTAGATFWTTNIASQSNLSSTAATNSIIPWISLMRNAMKGYQDKDGGGNTMEVAKDACMELYMAAVSAGAGLAKCGKTAAGGFTEATTLTGFVGGTACELEKSGDIIGTPWLNL